MKVRIEVTRDDGSVFRTTFDADEGEQRIDTDGNGDVLWLSFSADYPRNVVQDRITGEEPCQCPLRPY